MKTTCAEHRRQGYALVNGKWKCKGCGLPEIEHETIEETLTRRAQESAYYER